MAFQCSGDKRSRNDEAACCNERKLKPTLVALLEKLGARKDESYQLAARLAARLGLQVNMNNDAGWCGSGGRHRAGLFAAALAAARAAGGQQAACRGGPGGVPLQLLHRAGADRPGRGPGRPAAAGAGRDRRDQRPVQRRGSQVGLRPGRRGTAAPRRHRGSTNEVAKVRAKRIDGE